MSKGSRLMRDIREHDEFERMMRERRAVNVSDPAESRPVHAVASDGYRVSSPNRKSPEGEMRSRRHRR